MTAVDVRNRLIALGLVSDDTTSGWVCLVGGLSDRLARPQVAVLDTTGLSPLASHGTTGPTRPAFQILVRGEPDSYAATAAKAQAVWDSLHRKPFGDYLAVEGANSAPVWLGFAGDESRPQWSLNFTTIQS